METAGYFFCSEERALLCRKCDVAVHTLHQSLCHVKTTYEDLLKKRLKPMKENVTSVLKKMNLCKKMGFLKR